MSDLIERLTSESRDFNFFRAVQLLEEFYLRSQGIKNPIDSGRIRFKPDRSITFPPNDIAAIGGNQDALSFTLSFMGLVGVTSPLPVYFSEYILSHPETAPALYDFLTIFNHRMYALFYRAWKKYHFLFNFKSDGSDSFTQKIAMLAGLNHDASERKMRMLAYCGILSSSTRSASGLETMLSDFFWEVPVAVSEFSPRWAQLRNVKPIGGAPLGQGTILGTSYFDRAGKFRVVVGPLPRKVYETFLPGTDNISEMKEVIATYLSDPLDYDIEVQMQSTELVPVILGENETRLGETSSLGKSKGKTDIQSIVIR